MPRKDKYLIILVVLSLVGLSFYTTYGLYSNMVQDTDSLTYDISLNFVLNEDKNDAILINPSQKETFKIKITNPYSYSLKYQLFYRVLNDINRNDLELSIIDSSINLSSGIAGNTSLTIPIQIINNGENPANILIDTKISYLNNEITLASGEYPILLLTTRNLVPPSISAINANNSVIRGVDTGLISLFNIEEYNGNLTNQCFINDEIITSTINLEMGEYEVSCEVVNEMGLKAIAKTNLTVVATSE